MTPRSMVVDFEEKQEVLLRGSVEKPVPSNCARRGETLPSGSYTFVADGLVRSNLTMESVLGRISCGHLQLPHFVALAAEVCKAAGIVRSSADFRPLLAARSNLPTNATASVRELRAKMGEITGSSKARALHDYSWLIRHLELYLISVWYAHPQVHALTDERSFQRQAGSTPGHAERVVGGQWRFECGLSTVRARFGCRGKDRCIGGRRCVAAAGSNRTLRQASCC